MEATREKLMAKGKTKIVTVKNNVQTTKSSKGNVKKGC